MSQGLEKEQVGERFTLIDPARLPEKRLNRIRLAIRLIGLVLGVGAGVGTAVLREFADSSVHSAEQLSRAMRYPVLATIPVIDTPSDVARRRVKTAALVAGVVILIAWSLVIFHYQVMDPGCFLGQADAAHGDLGKNFNTIKIFFFCRKARWQGI